jgi:UDP-N-acetylmuramoyl-tripeptide--D-alanyl-D-alanine ligase
LNRTLAELARCTGARLAGADVPFRGVSTDTRTMACGDLFVALRGEHRDGHEFVREAAARGAVGALVDRELPVALPQVVAADALAALAEFARAWRLEFDIPVVAVTGSNGKTTTKELIGAMLASLGPCHVTRGNLNNHIGVPLTLLELGPQHVSAVIEMGANHPGEIAVLAALARPTIGIVTNAGAAHLEGFGGLDGVARGKGELFAALPRDGTAVINSDDPYAGYWRERSGAGRVVTFGLDQAADFAALDIALRSGAAGFETSFELVTPVGIAPATLHLAGRHNLRNAVGAAACAWVAGVTLECIVTALAQNRAVAGRLELRPAQGGAFLVDDSYNANPDSLRAGLEALAGLTTARWLVLGEMAELGDAAPELHAQIGTCARDSGIERLFAMGAGARPAVAAFGPGARWFDSAEALIAAVRVELTAGVTVLVKGSRVNRLERVVDALASDGRAHASGGHA